MADEKLDPTATEATPDEPTQDAPVVTPDPTPSTPTTSSDSSEASTGETPDTPAPVVAPVVVDNHTARDDNDAHLGTFVDVVDGEHKGSVGAYVQTVESDAKTGYPLHVLVRTRDEFNHLIQVAYKHVRPSRFTGGR